MKETGILRRIDELGRIVVPKEIRKKLKIREGDNLDIFVSEDNVILRKYSPLNDLEAILVVLLDAIKKINNVVMVVTDLTKVIASTKSEIAHDDLISEVFIQLLSQKEQIHINKSLSVNITENYTSNQNLFIKPIVIYGDLFGSVILFNEFETIHNQQEIIDLIHYFCTEYIQF
jgi:AbrB family transcriptional regulator (stage V sporulation protein T)